MTKRNVYVKKRSKLYWHRTSANDETRTSKAYAHLAHTWLRHPFTVAIANGRTTWTIRLIFGCSQSSVVDVFFYLVDAACYDMMPLLRRIPVGALSSVLWLPVNLWLGEGKVCPYTRAYEQRFFPHCFHHSAICCSILAHCHRIHSDSLMIFPRF